MGKCKRILCGMLISSMLVSTPVAAQAKTIIKAGIETEVVEAQPVKATNSKINTKSKTVTLYAGLTYSFRGNGFKREKASWKISDNKCATIKSDKYGVGLVTTKKAGKFTITGQQGKKKYTYKVTVKEDFSKRFLPVKSADGKNLTWEKVPGAEGYLVCRQYFSECGYNPYGWKDQEIVVLKDLKGNANTGYTIDIPDWQFYKSWSWAIRIKPYKKSGGKLIYTSPYPEDMTFNSVKLM